MLGLAAAGAPCVWAKGRRSLRSAPAPLSWRLDQCRDAYRSRSGPGGPLSTVSADSLRSGQSNALLAFKGGERRADSTGTILKVKLKTWVAPDGGCCVHSLASRRRNRRPSIFATPSLRRNRGKITQRIVPAQPFLERRYKTSLCSLTDGCPQ